jgi:hypothetical protein
MFKNLEIQQLKQPQIQMQQLKQPQIQMQQMEQLQQQIITPQIIIPQVEVPITPLENIPFVVPPLVPFGQGLPTGGMNIGFKKRAYPKEKATGYGATLDQAVFGTETLKLTKEQYKALQRQEFSGGESRAVIEIIPNYMRGQPPKPKKQIVMPKINPFKKLTLVRKRDF